MPRIRNIKPEFWTDEKLVDLGAWERLLFIGLWNFADDEGYMPYSAKRIKMQVFPGDDVEIMNPLENSGILWSLLRAGMVSLYDSDSGPVLHVKNWNKHQKPSHPSPSKYSGMNLVERPVKPQKQADPTPIDSNPGQGYQNPPERSGILRPEREVEGEREMEVGRGPLVTSQPPVTNARGALSTNGKAALRIVHAWENAQPSRPPLKTVQDVTAQVQALVSEGIPEPVIEAGLDEWWQGKYPPSTIPNYVARAGQPRVKQATGTQRAADILSIDTSSIQETA